MLTALERIKDATYARAYRTFIELVGKGYEFVSDPKGRYFDYFYVIPGKRLHDSGYKTFVIVANSTETKELFLMATSADHLWWRTDASTSANMEHHSAGVYGLWFRRLSKRVRFELHPPFSSTVEWIVTGDVGIVD